MKLTVKENTIINHLGYIGLKAVFKRINLPAFLLLTKKRCKYSVMHASAIEQALSLYLFSRSATIQ